MHHGWPSALEPAVTESPKQAILTVWGVPCAPFAARHARRIERRFMVTASLRLTSSESLLYRASARLTSGVSCSTARSRP